MNHPSPEDLVAHLIDADSTIAVHVATCPECQEQLTWIREAAGQLRAGTPSRWVETPQCLSEAAVAAFVDGQTTGAAREATVAHLAGCARCRAMVASVARLTTIESVAREAPTTARPSWRRWQVPVAAAAAVLLAVLAWPRGNNQIGTGHRAPTITAAAAPVPLAPVAAVAEARVLRWSAVPGADRYHVTLFDAGGGVRYEAQLADTVAALPDSVVLVTGQTYLWGVEARIGWDRWSTSPLTEFSIVGAPRR
ncbi:MAG TPA: zf-HC2 domain-containing protein [Gemmatimonadales bacterium]